MMNLLQVEMFETLSRILAKIRGDFFPSLCSFQKKKTP